MQVMHDCCQKRVPQLHRGFSVQTGDVLLIELLLQRRVDVLPLAGIAQRGDHELALAGFQRIHRDLNWYPATVFAACDDGHSGRELDMRWRFRQTREHVELHALVCAAEQFDERATSYFIAPEAQELLGPT